MNKTWPRNFIDLEISLSLWKDLFSVNLCSWSLNRVFHCFLPWFIEGKVLLAKVREHRGWCNTYIEREILVVIKLKFEKSDQLSTNFIVHISQIHYLKVIIVCRLFLCILIPRKHSSFHYKSPPITRLWFSSMRQTSSFSISECRRFFDDKARIVRTLNEFSIPSEISISFYERVQTHREWSVHFVC